MNRTAGGVGGSRLSRIPAERHAAVVAQRDGAAPVPINRAAVGGGGGSRRRIPAEAHAAVVAQRNSVPINRAAVGGGGSRLCRIPAERHAPIVAQHDGVPINRATTGVGGGRRRIPAESYAPVIAQRDGAVGVPINRAAADSGVRIIRNIFKRNTSIILVGRRIGLLGRNRNRLLHRFIVQHKL